MANILLVDDDPDILILGRTFLTNEGHTVDAVNSVMGALEKLRDASYDLLISDAGMPKLSGFDLIRSIKKDNRHQNLPIAMLTGKKEKQDIRRAIELGVDDYIIKPFVPDVFLKKVEELLKKNKSLPREKESLSSGHHRNVQCMGRVELEIEISRISESGLTILSPHFLDAGFTLNIESSVLREVGLFDPKMRVLSSTPVQHKGLEYWKTKLAFSETDERTMKQIRTWLKTREAV